MQQIGENISRLRKEQNMTQDEFALRLGVTPHEPVIIRLNQEKPINWGFALIQS